MRVHSRYTMEGELFNAENVLVPSFGSSALLDVF